MYFNFKQYFYNLFFFFFPCPTSWRAARQHKQTDIDIIALVCCSDFLSCLLYVPAKGRCIYLIFLCFHIYFTSNPVIPIFILLYNFIKWTNNRTTNIHNKNLKTTVHSTQNYRARGILFSMILNHELLLLFLQKRTAENNHIRKTLLKISCVYP